ncbi:hypothetical protein K6W21_24470 [Burkholderia latens]|uniref:hypothetical protein n=1 Tax=Burkholderia latens TaxID=488446 RepID=UPI001C94D24C|nr:hypothetical protein [Burkholderia latens]MBY4697231.1 hypothetical protein [Burkholderia latens]
MCRLFRFGMGLVCVGCSMSVLAQTYDDSTDDGATCRAVVMQAEIDGAEQQVVGRACRQSDGTWRMVQAADGSIVWYPDTAYPYTDPWYWGPAVFVGTGGRFVFIDRFHRRHHFDHFGHHPGHFEGGVRGRIGVPMGAGFHREPAFTGAHGFGGMRRH